MFRHCDNCYMFYMSNVLFEYNYSYLYSLSLLKERNYGQLTTYLFSQIQKVHFMNLNSKHIFKVFLNHMRFFLKTTTRTSHRMSSITEAVLKNSQESTCAKVSF